MDFKYTRQQLIELQSRPLRWKVQRTIGLITEWYREHEGKVYISFSGGKDSTVLLYLARKFFPDIPAVFVDTGLEYPEVREFALSHDNVVRLRPKMSFPEVLKKYGYPVIGKEVAQHVRDYRRGNAYAVNAINGLNRDGSYSEFRQRFKKYKFLTEAPFAISNRCCDVMKEQPLDSHKRATKRVPIIGTMTYESQRRQAGWLQEGCNAFKSGKSKPMSLWTEQDVLRYLKGKKIPYASVYGNIEPVNSQLTLEGYDGTLELTGAKRTGCMFCMFGIMLDKSPNRFRRMKQTHPRLYDYCIGGGSYDENGMLLPDKNGLGIGKVLDFIGVQY